MLAKSLGGKIGSPEQLGNLGVCEWKKSPSGLFGAHFTRSRNIIYRNDERSPAGTQAISAREQPKDRKAGGRRQIECVAPSNTLAAGATGAWRHIFISHIAECATRLSSWPHAYFNKVYLVYLARARLCTLKGGYGICQAQEELLLPALMVKYSLSQYWCCCQRGRARSIWT